MNIYISACNKYGYTQRTGCPSKRTFWNILNNCPASQRKSLAGLDNLASEGLDAYDTGTNHTEMLVEALTDNQQYLKAVYHIHCSSAECDGVVDHCLKYGLSTLDSKYPDDNQEMGKHKIFEKLGHETTIIVINFTMNF